MARAPKVFIPEVNYGMPDHLPNMLLDVPNLQVWKDAKSGRLGVWKKAGTDQQYRFATSNALFHGLIRIDEDVFTCSTTAEGQPMPVDKMVHALQNQLERYRYIRKEANDEFGVTKVKLSGKSGGENDDLVMTFMMALTWGTVYLLNPRTRESTRHNTVGGNYTTTIPVLPNADVERAQQDAAKQRAHDARFAQRVTTRVVA